MEDILQKSRSGRSVIASNIYIYIPAVLAVLAVKAFYAGADSDGLAWILDPTAWWVRVLSGIPFEKVSPVGHVSHAYRFIIAPSCSGVRFLLVIFVMTVFSFVHMVRQPGWKAAWLGISAVFSYVSTIFVNGIRITISIFLPRLLMEKELLTAERLHTLIGTVVYLSMLFVLYHIAGKIAGCFVARDGHTVPQRRPGSLAVPVFWYFVMVLGLPFLLRIFRGQWEGFGQYALLVSGACIAVTVFFAAVRRVPAILGGIRRILRIRA